MDNPGLSLITIGVIGVVAFAALLVVFAVVIGNLFVNSFAAKRASVLRLTPLQLALFGLFPLVILGVFGFLAFLAWRVFKLGGDGFPSFDVAVYFAVTFFAVVGVLAVGIAVANRQQFHAQAARDRQAQLYFERIRGGSPLEEPLFVFLRPFSAKTEFTPTEQLVIQLFEQRGVLICVHERGFQYGMGRLTFGDHEWQPAVLLLCERAAGIVMYPAAHAGTSWELEQIYKHGWLDRTLFIMPPSLMNFDRLLRFSRFWMRFADPKELEELEMEIAEAERETDIRGHWERARVRAREIGVDLPAYAGNGGIFRIKSGKLEWLAAFDRGIFFGKTPRRSLESLGPAIDEYVRAKA